MGYQHHRCPRDIGLRLKFTIKPEWTWRGSSAISNCLLDHLSRVEIAQWKTTLSRKDFRTGQARWVTGEELISPKRRVMKNGIVTVLAGAVMAVLATTVSTAEPTQVRA